MKILHVTRQYAPSVGGIQTMVAGLAAQQLASGHRVTVATLDRSQVDGRRLGPAREEIRGIDVHRLRHAGPRQYTVAPGVARLLAGFDVVHVHSMDFFCDFLAILKPWHRIPMVLTSHGLYFHTGDPLGLKSIYLRTITRAALSAYREVIAVSEADRERLQSVRRSVTVIPNGVDLERFERVETRPRVPTLLGIGAGEHWKRSDLLVETHRLLRAEIPDARLVLTATNGGEDGAVEWLGTVANGDLLELLARSSIVCSASDYEGFGYGVVEAMAAGVPAAVRPDHPLAGLADSGGVFVIDFREPQRAAVQLARLLFQPDRLLEAGHAARRAVHRFSWRRVMESYEKAYARARAREVRPRTQPDL